MKMKTLLLSLVSALGVSESATAAQYAVIASIIDYPGEANDLKGCHHDADLIEKMLLTRYAVPHANIVRLKDAKATTAGVRKAIQENLAARVQPGDSAVFFFSGHGTQVPDFDGDEKDDADEAICTYDMNATDSSSWLTDDVLRHEISAIKSNRVAVILDCCHAGTGTRGVLSDAANGIRYMDLGFGRPAELYRNLSIKTSMRVPSTNPNHVLLASCADREFSREDGPKGGYFTTALINELEKRGDTTPLDRLYESVRSTIAARIAESSKLNSRQTPQFEGDVRLSMRDLLDAKAPPGSNLAQTPPQPAKPTPPPEITNAASLPGDVPMALSTNKTDYVEGEMMTATLCLQKDAHLRLYYTDGEQRSFLIFPNKFHPTDEVKAGEEIDLPGKGAAFAFEMTYPKDRGSAVVSEVLTAVASTAPFTDTPSLRWGAFNFIECTGQRYQEIITRGIEVKPELKPGRTSVIYRVKAKSK